MLTSFDSHGTLLVILQPANKLVVPPLDSIVMSDFSSQ